jgi:hypothetical protein
MSKLPKGRRTLEDDMMLETLIKDPVFVKSVEEDFGKLRRMWVDWSLNRIVYEFLDNSVKESTLSLNELLKKMRDFNYMREFEH